MTSDPEPGRAVPGRAFYDREGVFERYREERPGVSSPNLVMEEPAFLSELGPPAGLRVADLGCGDAALGRTLLDAGCSSYLGVDASERMVRAARETLRDTAGEVALASIEDFRAPPETFDLIVSRLALHYVEDLRAVLAACRAGLAPRGRVVFTVLHPVITSHDARMHSSQLREQWIVDDYFVTGPREREWLGDIVTWHHRTVEQYVDAVGDAGLVLTRLRECPPQRERFQGDEAEYARRSRIPLFLLIAASRDRWGSMATLK